VAWHGARIPRRMASASGRALEAIRRRDLTQLFGFFGLEVDPDRVEALRTVIGSRFAVEVRELVRLCGELSERERFKLFREALRLSYESAVARAQHAAT
jgi:hypothetical protein